MNPLIKLQYHIFSDICSGLGSGNKQLFMIFLVEGTFEGNLQRKYLFYKVPDETPFQSK